MPENGVYHNLILAKIKTLYPGHAQQVMHAFWGVGQMSFVKHALFVGEDAPNLNEHQAITEHILNRIDLEDLMISRGVVDALDHSSNKFGVGGKLGIDATGPEIEVLAKDILSDEVLMSKFAELSDEVTALKQYFTYTKTPICFIKVEKTKSQKENFKLFEALYTHFRVLIVVDTKNNYLENPYMLLWRVVNNIDSNRDFVYKDDTLCIDATNKNIFDGFTRRWPDDVSCTPEVIERLIQRNILSIDQEFKKKFLL